MSDRGLPERARRALAAIFAPFDEVFAALDELRDAVLRLDAEAQRAARRLAREDAAGLRALLLHDLGEHQPLVAGIGAVFAPGALADTPRWLEWYWRRSPGSEPTSLVLPLDPAFEDFYDYERSAWFSQPRDTGARSIVGPHVDHGATRQHLVTPCTPITTADGRFLGVAAADLRVSEIEPIVLRRLRELGEPSALVNADGRVIASNTSGWVAGALIRDRRSPPVVTAETPEWSESGPVAFARHPSYPWALAIERAHVAVR
ncbi:hypothetical protein Q5424_26940 [Conexibacter sp. JD483]|uniref:PDC sensor domain-containing protein n=1 Tax=unclassified Conexibacter TaxID=2627773 RepID=UPI002722CA63|nr:MULTISPECIES: hypothetical protein [unclassified Conexibacter]MDO8187753.1 hypothetical protein [Conexibacter sp. CPCC 205706]MDO8201362.1 hypothetical protein [Conexibacter sp. CPCC 205762]MDR9372766.1 hypothetical protein [Conexibacter sp. JD483]